MLTNYLKITFRNLARNKGYSFINIGGLAVGMAVAMLIGLWVYDELSFNKHHDNYPFIAQVMEHQDLEQGIQTYGALPMPLSQELRTKYPDDFESVVAMAASFDQSMVYEDRKFSKIGSFAEAAFPEMFGMKMLSGSRDGLRDPNSILLSESLAKALFGEDDPGQKAIEVGGEFTLQVAGVYEDFPANSYFKDVAFVAPIKLLFSNGQMNNWKSSSMQIFTQLKPEGSFKRISEKIKNVFNDNNPDGTPSSLFLHPMSEWHLYSEWKNGTNAGGRIQFVWLFGIIGAFVLLLACINFMNLSTARSQNRAREVGIRKAMGSLRRQVIGQFFGESFLVVECALGLALLLTVLFLPFFNEMADKQMVVPWSNGIFWLSVAAFSLLTTLLAGSYPALYLSSFQPIKILKGGTNAVRVGRFAAVPRKVLVVVQFTVSVALIIGTLTIFRQIQFVKDRPVGYNREGLVNVVINSPDIRDNYEAIRNDLQESGAIEKIGRSSSPMTNIWSSANNLEWSGQDPNRQTMFGTISVTPDFGQVVGWKVKEGREFSPQFSTDTSAMMFNQAAIEAMGLGEPIGETVRWHGREWKTIGVIENMVMTSPFEPIVPTVFIMDERERPFNVIHLKLRPGQSTSKALGTIEAVFKEHNPGSLFEYKFADQEYAAKFAAEERIGTLAGVSTALAILISCLGLFGLASYVAEQRTKEIGVRKVLGASVASLWRLLSKDFVLLVVIALLIATPLAWYFMNGWLQKYTYRTELSWWIFVAAGAGALAITLLTVSFQAVKAALMNPVESLRSE